MAAVRGMVGSGFLSLFVAACACAGPADPGGPGERCFRAADCQPGLVCLMSECTNDVGDAVTMVDGPDPVVEPMPDAGSMGGTGGAAGGAGGVAGSAGAAGASGAGGAAGAAGAAGTAGAAGAGGAGGSSGAAGASGGGSGGMPTMDAGSADAG
jgi:pilus assembly protein FimV